MRFTGYIEGYYGKLLSWQERHQIANTCCELKLNSYLLAPKEDHYHRVGWREIPPMSYLDELHHFITDSDKKGVTVIPSIAPGLSFDFTSRKDRSQLLSRIEQFVISGATSIALLMDDIPLELPQSSKGRYSNLAEAQLELLYDIENSFDITLLFCPTVYTNQLIDSDEASNYLNLLAKKLSPKTYLFWTGKHTIAETIDKFGCGRIANLYPQRVIFWDNYYSNDYCPTRLFIGPYAGRDQRFIEEECAGIMINPTGLFNTDKLLLKLFALWFEREDINSDNWINIATSFGVPRKYKALLPWFMGPYSPANAEELLIISDDPISFFTEYIVEWNSPLKLEWYPYLHNLFTEIKLLTGKTITDRQWYDLRFPPAHAERLFREEKE